MCECGCGSVVNEGRHFVRGHNRGKHTIKVRHFLKVAKKNTARPIVRRQVYSDIIAKMEMQKRKLEAAIAALRNLG